MNSVTKSHLALLSANAIYGINYLIAKEVMNGYVHPFGLVLLRGLFAVSLFWIVHKFFVDEKIEKKDLKLIAICALFGIAINQLMFLKGLSITTPINASIIITSTPVLVMFLSAIILKEDVTLLKTAGILLGITGAVLIISFEKDFSFGSETFSGDLMIFINALSYGTYLVLVKPLMSKYNPLTVIKYVFAAGLLYVFPFGYGELSEVSWQTMPVAIIMGVLFVLVFATFIAYFFNAYALKHLSPSIVSFYLYLQPVFATLIAFLYGKDHLSPVKILSACLIFTGVYLVSRRESAK